jgi:hypothetical protein
MAHKPSENRVEEYNQIQGKKVCNRFESRRRDLLMQWKWQELGEK